MTCTRLIVTADDFGVSEQRNIGIARSVTDGVVTSVSLMVNTAHTAHALALASKHGFLSQVGLHLNFTEGEPLACPTRVPSLLDPGGTVFRSKVAFRLALGRGEIRPAEIALEAEAQLVRLTECLGWPPVHVDSQRPCRTRPVPGTGTYIQGEPCQGRAHPM